MENETLFPDLLERTRTPEELKKIFQDHIVRMANSAEELIYDYMTTLSLDLRTMEEHDILYVIVAEYIVKRFHTEYEVGVHAP